MSLLRNILVHGLVAGVVAGGALSASTILLDHQSMAAGMLLGYASMLLALSAVFVGIKRHRDVDRGGVIRFWPALGLGLAISLVASLLYVLAWELTQAMTHMHFAEGYARAMIAQARAEGVTGAKLAALVAEMDRFRLQYANPLYRLPMTFIEIFPVGVLVSLVSAGLLRNPRFLPARG